MKYFHLFNGVYGNNQLWNIFKDLISTLEFRIFSMFLSLRTATKHIYVKNKIGETYNPAKKIWILKVWMYMNHSEFRSKYFSGTVTT